MSSLSSEYGVPSEAVYSASKFFVRGLTEAMNIEWERHGIHVSDVMPNFVRTPMMEGVTGKLVDSVGIHLTAEDVVRAIWRAASDRRRHPLGGGQAEDGAAAAGRQAPARALAAADLQGPLRLLKAVAVPPGQPLERGSGRRRRLGVFGGSGEGAGPDRRGAARRRGRSRRGGAAGPTAAGRSRRWRWSARRDRARPCSSPTWCAGWSRRGSSRSRPTTRAARPAPSGRWRCWRRPTRRRACCAGGACPRRRSTASSTRPLYHPDYEAIAEWLTGKAERPKVEGMTEAALDRAHGLLPAASVDPRRARERRACAGRTSSRAGSGATSRSTSG